MIINDALVKVRVPASLKKEAADVFQRNGLSLSTAVRMYFVKTVKEDRLLFDPEERSAVHSSLNETAIRAGQEARKRALENGLSVSYLSKDGVMMVDVLDKEKGDIESRPMTKEEIVKELKILGAPCSE